MGEPIDPSLASGPSALSQEFRGQEFAADCSDRLCRATFHQHYPTRHCIGVPTVSFLLGRDLAYRRIRFTEVRADCIGMLDEPRQDQLRQPAAQLLVASWLRTELHGGHAPADVPAEACRHATRRAGRVLPQWEEVATSRSWVVEPGQIGREPSVSTDAVS